LGKSFKNNKILHYQWHIKYKLKVGQSRSVGFWGGFFRWVYPKKHSPKNPLCFFGYGPGCLNPDTRSRQVTPRTWRSLVARSVQHLEAYSRWVMTTAIKIFIFVVNLMLRRFQTHTLSQAKALAAWQY